MSVPSSTYRIQLQAGFNFKDAGAVAGYLRDLGISHIYCSPYLQAAAGSTHGYDVVSFSRVSDEIGGETGRREFCERLGEAGLGQVLDIVPNHMAIGSGNAWWWDALENGAASRYAPYFDIDWNAPEERLRNKILLPLLGDHYGRVLAAGGLKLERSGAGFHIRYGEHTTPLSPESAGTLLAEAASIAGSADLAFLADALGRLPGSAESDWNSRMARHRDKEVIRQMLERLLDRDGGNSEAGAIDQVIGAVNHDPDRLDELISRQNYRLSRWRMAQRELVYRRFFDVNTLVGIRTEEEHVFEDTHRLVIGWLWSGELDGVRVDHPDGLSDPEQYFKRLRQAAPKAWIVAEKILQPGERLPESWNVAGTTGYDFLNLVSGLFVDSRSEAQFNELYREFTGEPLDFAAVAREKKSQVLRDILGSDVNRLTALFLQICEDHREQRDYTRHEIHDAIRDLIAGFPVYRTYARAGAGVISESGAAYIVKAVETAKAGRPDLEPQLFDFLGDVLLLGVRGERESEFVMRFQQVTAAAMAKGVEDTAFYSYVRLVSRNEVGGDPGRFAVSVDEFHRWCTDTQRNQPYTMLATSTHDTKRSGDVRARISVLSEMPAAWADAVRRWSAANARHRTGEFPDRKTEYLLYQTLAGAWPISCERLTEYMLKAVREAKERTSWITRNALFEEALQKFIAAIIGDGAFIADLETFLGRLIPAGQINSLSQTLLKATAPGIPDFYQGTELWDLSLVDPDNRRPVDFELRRRLLAALSGLGPRRITERSAEGLPKLWTIRQALCVRKARAASFAAGYRPLWAAGPKAAHLVAFLRGDDVITVVPRLTASLGGWEATVLEIPGGAWRNVLTGEAVEGGKVEIGTLLDAFPVALLARETP
jgi:(1->4)-alpha-D-glucan 1-alpha-D-glucosylmutase